MKLKMRNFSLWILLAVNFLCQTATCENRTRDLNSIQALFSSAVAQSKSSLSTLAASQDVLWSAITNSSSCNPDCLASSENLSVCVHNMTECLTLKDVSVLYKLDMNEPLTQEQIQNISPALLYSFISCNQQKIQDRNKNKLTKHAMPTSEASWGYSFLFVTLINLSSLTGALILPCTKLNSYKVLLMFMVALAVGTLAGSGLLFLIPEAFHLVHDDDMSYIWKASAIMAGIYLFYFTEKIMRMINSRRENTNLKKKHDELATEGTLTTSFRRIPLDNSIPGRDLTQIPSNIGGICSLQIHSNSSSYSISSQGTSLAGQQTPDTPDGNRETLLPDQSGDQNYPIIKTADKVHSNGHCHSHHHHHAEDEIAPVAYMIIFGDALHNFIDGLSIGSAFTQSIMTGVGVSVAVLCEELPHELGDFAILLNSGMKFKKAILYNFLSACTCYFGVMLGIVLGENTSSHEWVFAVAGGMFLYISLVDMMPEMNTAAESEEGKKFGEMKTFMLQNAGLITGYLIMLILAIYGGSIEFE
ncbi:metal cation symporter ZIP14-like [Physella acuta]|uniref:metal cation symporter ZIP14-like n=1 Tax=Physella acuta TaxID=109671 RepID=UPI0027DB2F24|nr:metal cation symporter ZIP14-like [Physella acuta]XP_059170869.1 metal cation symporter ZIP14-like [Physella acuta]